MTVDVSDLLAIGGPTRSEIEAGLFTEDDFLYFAQAALRGEMQGIFARFIGEIGDGLAVGRPGRIALHHRGGIGEVANVAFFRGYGQYFSARLENRARSGGRDMGIVQTL